MPPPVSGNPLSTPLHTGRGFGFSTLLRDLPSFPPAQLLGHLTLTSQHHADSLSSRSVAAWDEQCRVLANVSRELLSLRADAANWRWVVEFDIPRRGKRIDTVLLTDRVIFVLEFKVGEKRFHRHAHRQAEDYALELTDFHRASQDRVIYPVLIATGASASEDEPETIDETVQPTRGVMPADLARWIMSCQTLHAGAPGVDIENWTCSPYSPTPTIIEAAQRLYTNHSVRDITRSDAARINLTRTKQAINAAVEDARGKRRKVICFVTGVPGAGKTLAGLNATVGLQDAITRSDAVYLSGNGPLVKVLTEALARDERVRTGQSLDAARRKTGQFIQNVHRFINTYLESDSAAPSNHVAVFDEAQRAWSREHAQRKFGRSESEPESMLGIMNRHPEWAVLVGLVGGGQEINTGEAGLREWGRAIEQKFPAWKVHVSPQLLHGHAGAVGQTLFAERPPASLEIVEESDLHLSVSTRSYRTESLAAWVEHTLANRPDAAAEAAAKLDRFPLVMTRSLDAARAWLRDRTRGLRRCGLIASSGGKRLRRFGVSVDEETDPAHWFLAGPDDVRSSLYLELVATEFDVQGLELDWTGVCWDADLRRVGDEWAHFKFKGTRWTEVKQDASREYLRNKYRVLLTRAREGTVIWVPPGDASDPTCSPAWYDALAVYLKRCGVRGV